MIISTTRALPIGLSALVILSGALADSLDYLFRNELLCDTNNVLCFRGTLSYRPNPRLLSLNARVQTAPGPGLLRITLTGANQQGQPRVAPFEVRVRGNRSEIIDHQMIPDYPDVAAWAVDSIEFVADETG